MINRIKNIIFDYGGTLDTDGVHWSENFWDVYQHFRIPVDKKDFKEAFIYSEKNIAGVIKQDYGLLKTYKTQLEYQFKYLEEADLISGFSYVIIDEMCSYILKNVLQNISSAKEVLSLLAQNYRLGLISNYYGNVETVLRETDIRKYFSDVIDSAAVGYRKPDKKIFVLAFERLKADPENTIVAGDSYENDIVPAKELNCSTVWLNGRHWQTPDDIKKADIIIKSIKDFPEALKVNMN